MYDEIFIDEHLHVYVLPDNEMSELIDKDLEVMERAFHPKVFSVPRKEFRRILESHIFVFQHVSYVTCSSVTLDALDLAGVKRNIIPSDTSVDHKCDYCYAFLPYLHDNRMLRATFSGNDLFQQHSQASPIPNDSPFTAPFEFFGTGRKYSENVWSARLTNSLNNYYFIKDFTFSGRDAMQFSSHQYYYSGLPSSLIRAYFFRGTPDIRFKVSRIITLSQASVAPSPSGIAEIEQGSDVHDSSFENDSIEAALQPFNQTDDFPPKLGELISGMYLSIQFSMLRKLLDKRHISKIGAISHGLLLTRSAGMIGLTLQMPVGTVCDYDKSKVLVSGDDFGCFTLTANHICYAFREYLLKGTKQLAAVLGQTEMGEDTE